MDPIAALDWHKLANSFARKASEISEAADKGPEAYTQSVKGLRRLLHYHRQMTHKLYAPLEAPEHLRGKLGRFADPALKQERSQWALEAGRAGYPSTAVAAALGISAPSARAILIKAGWRWHEQSGRRLIDRNREAWAQPTQH